MKFDIGQYPHGDWQPVFAEDDVVIPRGRRVNSGPVPLFGDMPRWDLTAMGLAPNMYAASAQLVFDRIPKDWVLIAKTLAMAMLNPGHQKLLDAGLFGMNHAYKMGTIRGQNSELALLAVWSEKVGLTADLSRWTEDDCRSYLLEVETVRSKYARQSAQNVLRRLYRCRGIMGGRGLLFEVEPAGSKAVSGEIMTRPISPEVFWPLIKACWTYIDVYAPDVIRARNDIQMQISRSSKLKAEGRGKKISPRERRLRIDRGIDAWLASSSGFIPLHTASYGKARRGEVNWGRLGMFVSPFGGGRHVFEGTCGERRRTLVMESIRDGFPAQYGLIAVNPIVVDRSDGTRGPWCLGFDDVSLWKELVQLRNACYIFVSIMSMMRDSEVQGIAAGALVTHYGAPAVESKVHKHRPDGGTPRRWWVSDPVVKAIEVAEAIALDEDKIFGSAMKGMSTGFKPYSQIPSFVSWVNSNADERGLDRIPVERITPHMFRRTMSMITANEPDGEIALGITLKHNAVRALANATTSGYGAATPAWAREFEHEQKNVNAGELVSDWSRNRSGEIVARGGGEKNFVDGLNRVSEKLESVGKIGDERMLRNLLRDEFSSIRLGTINHCLGDPQKALCLEGQSELVRAEGPIPSMCQPATCRNSVITVEQLSIWMEEEKDLTAKLSDRRMSEVHRARLVKQLDSVRTVLGSRRR
ncbi:hypothetical protein [Tomitella biformata]|uniref:hypothetical protein n=1 Tax=Tomitella biformata TaxID=630403 RepID=UPI0004ACDCB2|nr:hypothetical protein [Tomitella biformata]